MGKTPNNSMGYAIVGTHRVGKSTIAEAVAEALGIKFVPTSASEVFKDMGLDPCAVLPFEDRLMVQREILNRSCEIWSGQTDTWITDRSPIDFMAYMVNDSFSLGDEHYEQWERFYNDCMDEHYIFFEHTFLIEPDGVIEEGDAPLKGRASRVLQNCMNLVYKGIINENMWTCDFTIIDRHHQRWNKSTKICDTILTLEHEKGAGRGY